MIKLIIIKTVLFYFPPVIAICSAKTYFSNFCRCPRGVRARTSLMLLGQIFIQVTPVDQLQKELGMRFYCTCYLHMVRSRCISQEGQVKLNFGNVPHFFRPKLSFTIRSSLLFKPALKDNWHCFLHRESTTELS